MHPPCRFSCILLLVCLLVPPAWLRAVAPANDQCSGAQVVPGQGPFPYWTTVVDITDATIVNDPSEPQSCEFGFSDTASRSVWYRFAPTESGPYLFSVCDDGDPPADTTVSDTIMAVYTSAGGCAGPFTEVANGCNDDFCGPFGLQSGQLLDLLAGTTYYIVIWQYDDEPPAAGQSSLQLVIKPSVVPDNDLCANAEELLLHRPVRGSTIGAVNDYQIANFACFTGIGQIGSVADGQDVVFRFVSPEDGVYSIKAFGYSGLSDLVIYVAESCPTGASPINVLDCLGAANRNPVSSAESVVCLPLAASQEVFVFVDEDGVTAGSTFLIEVALCIPETEPNNNPETSNFIRSGMTGSLGSAGDVDMFSLGIPPYGARVFALLDAEAANLPDFDLRVTTESDTLEFDNDDNDSFFGDSGPNIGGTPLRGEPGFLRVNFSGPVAVEPYLLYAVVQPPSAEAIPEVEPNGTLVAAQSAALNYFQGSLAGPSPSQDVDYYRFNAAAGDLIFLSLDADPTRDATPINARLELQDGTGNSLLTVNDLNDSSTTDLTSGTLNAYSPSSPAESIAYRTPEDGVFYARVSIDASSSGDLAAGDYLLSISLNCYVGSGGTNHPPAPFDLQPEGAAVRGEPIGFTGRVADRDLHQLQTVAIDWGDGAGLTTLANVGTGLPFATNHVYASTPPGPDGSAYTVTVVAEDPYGVRGTNTASIVVLRVQPARFLSVAYGGIGAVQMSLVGSPQEFYQVWASTNFQTWTLIGSATADASGAFTVTDLSQPKPTQRFYRAVSPATP